MSEIEGELSLNISKKGNVSEIGRILVEIVRNTEQWSVKANVNVNLSTHSSLVSSVTMPFPVKKLIFSAPSS